MDEYPQKSVLWRIPFKKAAKILVSCASIISLIFGIGAFWMSFFNKSVRYELLGCTELLEVNRVIDGLAISYNGEDLLAKRIDLNICQIQITNTGSADLCQRDFSTDDKWGVYIDTANVIEVRLNDTNSPHIRKSLQPMVAGSNSVFFNPIMFDSGDFFVIDVILRYTHESMPKFRPIGKISGIASGEPMSVERGSTNKSILDEYFHGGAFVNVSRAGICMCLSIAAVIGFYNIRRLRKIARGRKGENKRREEALLRQQQVDSVLSTMTTEEASMMQYLAQRYIDYGSSTLRKIDEMLREEDHTAHIAPILSKLREHEETVRKMRSELVDRGDFTDLLEELLDKEIIIETEGKILITTEFKRACSTFLSGIRNE